MHDQIDPLQSKIKTLLKECSSKFNWQAFEDENKNIEVVVEENDHQKVYENYSDETGDPLFVFWNVMIWLLNTT